ncbi:MAG: acetyl-CoA carboxylase biotin carboxyl carrier protein [Fimbriimonadales bacterium]
MNGFESEEVERLVRLANARGLTYVGIESGDRQIVLEFGDAPSATASSPLAEEEPGAESAVIKSGYVGFFRHEAEVGASVEAGDVVGIVEALGLPNDVVAHVDAIVEELLAHDGQTVEYGQPVAKVRVSK